MAAHARCFCGPGKQRREKNQQMSKNLSAAVEYWDVTIAVATCIHVWSDWQDHRFLSEHLEIYWPENKYDISLNHTQGVNSHNNKKQHSFLLFRRKRLETQQPPETNKFISFISAIPPSRWSSHPHICQVCCCSTTHVVNSKFWHHRSGFRDYKGLRFGGSDPVKMGSSPCFVNTFGGNEGHDFGLRACGKDEGWINISKFQSFAREKMQWSKEGEKQRKDRRMARMGLWGGAKGRSETPRRRGPHILKETRLKEIR